MDGDVLKLLELIYIVLSISSVQQNDPVIQLYTLYFSFIFHHVPSQVTGHSSLCYTAGPHCLPILNVNSLTLNSQSIPLPPPLALATTSLLSLSKSLFLFCRTVPLCHILDSTCGIIWYLPFFLSMRIHSSIYVAANGIILFISMAE